MVKDLFKELGKKAILLQAPTKIKFVTKGNKTVWVEALKTDLYIKLSDVKKLLKKNG